jgi:hypothetical protein
MRSRLFIILSIAGMALSTAALSADETVLSTRNPDTDIQNEPDTLGAIFRTGTVLGVGTVWYHIDTSNRKDQIYSVKESLYQRFTGFDSWRYDSNLFETNTVGHPAAGALYYLGARYNGFGRFGSYMFAIGGSAMWEFFCEVQEVVSINDMIHTPFGGAAIGEPVYQLIETVRYTGDRTQPMENQFNPFSSTVPVYLGGGYDGEGYALLGVEYEGINSASVLSNQTYSGFINETMLSRIEFRSAFRHDDIEFIRFNASSTLAGYGSTRSSSMRNEAYGFLAGLSSGYTYETSSYGSFTDRIGIVHLLGLDALAFYRHDSLHLIFNATVSGDFANIASYGMRAYYDAGHSAQEAEDNGGYITARQGYYHGYGSTAQTRILLGYGKSALALEGGRTWTYSLPVDGRTNRIKAKGRNFPLKDTRDTARIAYSYQILPSAAIRTGAEARRLWGSADGISRSAKEYSCDIALAYTGI